MVSTFCVKAGPWLLVILWALYIYLSSSIANPDRLIPAEIDRFLRSIKFFEVHLNKILAGAVHFFNYFVLSNLFTRASTGHSKPRLWQLLLAITFSLGFAYFDETHQEQVEGRAFQRMDLIIDGLGSFFGSIAYAFCTRPKITILARSGRIR